MLPDVDALLKNPGLFQSPRFHLKPKETDFVTKNCDCEDRIMKNISPTELFGEASTFDLQKLLAWLQSKHFEGKCNLTTVLLHLWTVESL